MEAVSEKANKNSGECQAALSSPVSGQGNQEGQRQRRETRGLLLLISDYVPTRTGPSAPSLFPSNLSPICPWPLIFFLLTPLNGLPVMKKSNINRSTSSYMIEAALAIAFGYFLLGGAEWSPATWAIFAFFAIWIVVMHVRRDAGIMSNDEYERWRSTLGFLMVLGLIVVAFYKGSYWLFIIGLILGVSLSRDIRRLYYSRRGPTA
jgi:hypothetical protein